MAAMVKVLVFGFFVLFADTLIGQTAATGSQPPGLTVGEILERMKSHDEYQNRRLLGYRAKRNFSAANLRFKMNASLLVETVFQRPDSMDSTVVSHTGSDFIRERVFDEILKAEGETHKSKDKQQVDITPRN